MTRFLQLSLVSIVFFTVNALVFADQTQSGPVAPRSGFFVDYLEQMAHVEKKLVDLAEAVPTEKFGWRPAEGVRSVSEVYMHVAVANFYIPKMIGHEPPAGFSGDIEKTITEKSSVVANLKQSVEHLRKAVMQVSDSDLEKPADFFGQKTTVRGILFNLMNHMHEHLGQSIAYARSNGVVPPWSASGQ